MFLIDSLDRSIAAKRLLDHSFYTRWNRGELSLEDLQSYAKQYYHYALSFPTFLSGAHAGCDELEVRQAILENLIEEERGPENHPELWLRFCEALGLTREEVVASIPNASTRKLIETMKKESLSGTHRGLAALYAYESQVPAVAKAKIEGLASYYGIDDPRAIAFFTVHMQADVAHAATSRLLLSRVCDDGVKTEEAGVAVDRTLEDLYGFLSGVETRASVA